MATALRIESSPAVCLVAAVSAYLNYARSKNLSPRTLEYLSDRLRQFSRFMEEHYPGLPLSEITASVIREFATWVKERTSAPSANHSLAVTSRFFKFLAAEGFVPGNPAASVEKLRTPKLLIETFSEGEIKALLATHGGNFYHIRDRAILLVLLDCGIRASELCNLRLEDVDFVELTVRVTGKGSKERVVPFGQATRQALSQYLGRRGELETPYVFVSHLATKLTRFTLRQIVRRRCKEAGITGVRCSPHTLRHTCAVSYLRSGGDTFSLQMLLGHTSQAMTKRYCESLNLADLQHKHRQFSPADSLNLETKHGRRRLK